MCRNFTKSPDDYVIIVLKGLSNKFLFCFSIMPKHTTAKKNVIKPNGSNKKETKVINKVKNETKVTPTKTKNENQENVAAEEQQIKTFAELGVCEPLCEACDALGFPSPTEIQSEAIPYALEGRDIIGLAQTGSGKTAAFALPILQSLLKTPRGFFACIVAPTRELAIQIRDQFEALGAGIGIKCAVLIGGVDPMSQAIVLAKKPHIIIGKSRFCIIYKESNLTLF